MLFRSEVVRKSNYLEKKFDELVKCHPKMFSGHRGKGLMQGLACVATNTDVVKALRDEKLLSLAAGENHVRFLPPLIVS